MVYSDPVRMMSQQIQMNMKMAEAGALMWMRFLSLSGGWSFVPERAGSPSVDTPKELASSGHAALRATLRGQGSDKIMDVTLKSPLSTARATAHSKTRANADRLAKRGPATLQEV